MDVKQKKEKKTKHKKHSKKDVREKRSKRQREAAESDSEDEGNTAAALASKAQAGQLSEDDYFSRNPEFSTWLVAEKGRHFNQLTAEESRELFAKFVSRWNAKKLPAKYYAGLAAPASMRRTGHDWGLRGGTERTAGVGMAAAVDDEAADRTAGRQAERQERKRWRSDQKELLDEMLPKATGREAQIEKRMGRREAARERDSSPVMDRLPGGGGDIMGGEDSFAAARAREQLRTQRRGVQQAVRQENLTARTSTVAASEEATMASFRAMLAQGPIKIAKRQ